MSSPSRKPWAAEGGKAALPKLFPLPKGGCGWDIAEYVMYCHLCGALSETCNTFMGYDAVRLRTAFVFLTKRNYLIF